MVNYNYKTGGTGRRESRDIPSGSFCFGGIMEYIDMEEGELECAVSPEVLYRVMLICGPETRDMLLYPVVEDVRLHGGFNTHAI
jgi:hypothetical protein